MTQGPLHRWLAVAMLIYALADVYADSISPQQCCEWIDGLAVVDCPARVSNEVSNAAPSMVASNQSRQESSVPSDNDEDCFCCCGHMLPGINFKAPVVELEASQAPLIYAFLPAPPTQKKFHPPRLS